MPRSVLYVGLLLGDYTHWLASVLERCAGAPQMNGRMSGAYIDEQFVGENEWQDVRAYIDEQFRGLREPARRALLLGRKAYRTRTAVWQP